ncbi:hypothetical protein WICPIJ_004899 [Wickerhamomyces pijperi]|uniref:Uncharacterized protein n=1 Tax=Wickerhamomyces pijperi TaxID=599730 RepID=A0A9P8Q6S9_WICPI|nr:hypothetical protein WICPIJ_004899 [Wickerhamomyces pijperi]
MEPVKEEDELPPLEWRLELSSWIVVDSSSIVFSNSWTLDSLSKISLKKSSLLEANSSVKDLIFSRELSALEDTTVKLCFKLSWANFEEFNSLVFSSN